MGQLLQVGVLVPHGLSDHLGQFHGSQGWRQPTIATQNIHTGLDKSDRSVQDSLRVLLEFRRQLHAGQMGLEEEIDLDVGIRVLLALWFIRESLAQLSKDAVFLVSNGDALELRGAGDDLHQTPDLRLGSQRHTEQL